MVEFRRIVNGFSCRYFECGDATAEVIVLLPSMLVTGPSYDTTAAALAKQGYHVFVVELPGSGASARLYRPWSFERYAEWVIAWLDAVDLKMVMLIGHSNSGAVVLTVTGAHPERVTRAVLVDSIGFDRSQSLLRLLAMRALDAAIEWKLTISKVHHALYNVFAHPRNFAHQIWISATDDMLDYATAVKVPTLLAWGRRDHTLPLRCMDRLKSAVPHSQTYISETGSHDWIVDHAEEFASAVVDSRRSGAATLRANCS